MTDDLKPCRKDVQEEIADIIEGAQCVVGFDWAYVRDPDDVAHQILSAITPAVVETPSGWRSMDSAPRDGTPVLAVNRRHPNNHRICVWENSRWRYGWEGADWKFDIVLDPQPTHWMPLPPSPDTQDAVQEAARVEKALRQLVKEADACGRNINAAWVPLFDEARAALRAIEGAE